MTYCVGILLKDGIVFASDSRTNAGVDNFATFCKMTVFEQPGDRVIILLSSGNLAGTQAVVTLLRQRTAATDGASNLLTAHTMFDVESGPVAFNASFIVGGQLRGEAPRLFRIYSEGNFIEAGDDTQFLQIGETKYGKTILDRVLTPTTSLSDATKCVLVSFDSTMRSNLSVGMPIDLVCYQRDSLEVRLRRRFLEGDAEFVALSTNWSAGICSAFRDLPELKW